MALIENINELRELTSLLSPELIRFLELSQNKDVSFIPVQGDKLITQSEVAKMLKVTTTTVSHYAKSGLLKPVYTPESSIRKYWLSEVKALPKREPDKAPRLRGRQQKEATN